VAGALWAAADAADIRVGTFVLNAAFYSPALLARDAVAVDVLSDGRLELGLGTGYVREEFEAAEIPYPTAGQRVDHLRHVTTYLKGVAPSIPILIAGNGDRVLRIAAQHADIIGFTGGGLPTHDDPDPMAERVEFVRAAAGDRVANLEFNLAITAVPTDTSGIADLTLTRAYFPEATDEQLRAMPTVLEGTPRDIADAVIDLVRDDELPGLALDAALSRDGVPGMIIVFRELPPAEGSVADFSPPEGLVLPPGLPGRQKN
jgi:probable F420-dependent oxidoreductase